MKRPAATRKRAERAGRQGEFRAAMFLRLQGWQILAERVKTPLGEIDLIARRNGVVAFTEVKWANAARIWIMRSMNTGCAGLPQRRKRLHINMFATAMICELT